MSRCLKNFCSKNPVYAKIQSFMYYLRSSRKYLFLFLLYFLLTISVPFFHSHAEGGIIRDHNHIKYSILYLGSAPAGSCCELHETDRDSAHTHHGHFLIDSHSVIVNSCKSDESDALTLKYGLLPTQAPLFTLYATDILVVQLFPGSLLRGNYSIFSGLSPPHI